MAARIFKACFFPTTLVGLIILPLAVAHGDEVNRRWNAVYLGVQGGAVFPSYVDLEEYAIVMPSGKAPWTNEPYVEWSEGFLGAQVGATLQRGNWVGGVELSATATKISGDQLAPQGSRYTQDETDDRFSAEIGPIFQASARIGRAWKNSLIYGKVGLALTQIYVDSVDLEGGNLGNHTVDHGQWHQGLVLGAGIEQAIMGRWSVAAEYAYINFQTERHDLDFYTAAGTSFDPTYITALTDADIHSATARLNFKLQGP